jgi:cytochrome d ubiquinol oxidase subunit II
MIHYKMTVANAAVPGVAILPVLGPGLFVLPVIALYTAAVYWLFRGKLRPAENYASGDCR